MKNNSTIWIIIVAILLVIIIGLASSMASIYFAKDKIGHQNKFINNRPPKTASKVYEAPSGDWTLEYPTDWNIYEDKKDDGLIIKKEEINPKLADSATIRISRGEIDIAEVLTANDRALSYTKTEVEVDGVKGIKVDGVVKPGGESMYAPGTKVVEYYFELNDNDFLTIQTTDEEYAEAIDGIVRSMKFNLQGESTKTETNNSSTSVSESGNVKIYAPIDGEKISSPYVLTGEAIAFEGTVNYSLYDDSGNVLSEGFMQTLAPDMGQFGTFNKPITFITSSTSGTLEVFTYSAKDGSKQDVAKVNVKF